MTAADLLNKQAPKFQLPDQNNVAHALADYKGKWVVLYFYPKDMTPGCTMEACDFRDNLARVKAAGAAVLGVSADTPASHAKFVKKEGLTFPLLADESKDVLKAYGVWRKKKFMGREFTGIVRTTVLIDPAGKVRKVYDGVKVKGHVDEVLKDLKSLK